MKLPVKKFLRKKFFCFCKPSFILIQYASNEIEGNTAQLCSVHRCIGAVLPQE